MKGLNRTVEAMPRSGIRAIMDLASRTPDVIHLEVGQPDFDTPEHIVEAAARAAADGYTRYTPNAGLPEVRAAFADKVRSRNGIEATPEQVIVTVGAINALMLSIHVLCDPGDTLLIPDPGWPNNEMIALTAGATPVRYPLLPDHGFTPDLDALERVAARPEAKAIIVNTPGNPTGGVLDRPALEAVLDIAERHDLWVIADECYEDIVFEGPHISPASIGASERVISIFSTSKSYAMTGWRVGYAVAPGTLATTMAKLTEAVTSCVTAVAQKAAQAAVSGDQTCVAEMRDAYRRRRDLAAPELEAAGILVARPRGAFYTMVDGSSAGLGGYELAARLISEHGVAIAPGETFGPSGAGMMRLSLAAADAAVAEGVRRIVSALGR